MRTILLAGAMALALVQTGLAAGKKPPYDPIHDPSLTQTEMSVRTGMIALASALNYNCPNVPWQLSTNFGRSLVAWTRQQQIPPERVQYIAQIAEQMNQFMPCQDIPGAMAEVSRNWMQ
jgi:hypothetical protein